MSLLSTFSAFSIKGFQSLQNIFFPVRQFVGGTASDELGQFVSASANGLYANAVNDDSDIVVYYKNNGIWAQQQVITPPTDTTVLCTAMNEDGDVMAVAGFTSFAATEAYRIYTRSGTTWTLSQSFDADNAGVSAIDYSGDYIAFQQSGVSPYTNVTSVYFRSGGSWSLQADIPLATQQNLPQLTNSCWFSSDGQYLCTAYTVNGVSDPRRIDVYLRTGTSWALQQTLPVPTQPPTYNIQNVRMSANGDLIVAADPTQQLVRVWTRSGSTWTQQSDITAPSGDLTENFANCLALSGDGQSLFVGANIIPTIKPNGDPTPWGGMYYFANYSGSWTQVQRMLNPLPYPTTTLGPTLSPIFPSSLAANDVGSNFVVGVQRYWDRENAEPQYEGAVYMYANN